MLDWTPKDLEEKLANGDKVFLKLWKKGCGACKLSIPALERLEGADSHGLTFGQINAGEHPEILEISDSDVLPVFFVFKNRKMAGKFIGFKGLERLRQFIDESAAD